MIQIEFMAYTKRSLYLLLSSISAANIGVISLSSMTRTLTAVSEFTDCLREIRERHWYNSSHCMRYACCIFHWLWIAAFSRWSIFAIVWIESMVCKVPQLLLSLSLSRNRFVNIAYCNIIRNATPRNDDFEIVSSLSATTWCNEGSFGRQSKISESYNLIRSSNWQCAQSGGLFSRWAERVLLSIPCKARQRGQEEHWLIYLMIE